MKHLPYIILIISLLNFSCKRKRKINVEGTVTDIYTGQSVPNIMVQLHSQIEEGVSGGTTNDYETITDANGKYYFKNAVFSKPGNSSWLEIPRTTYETVKAGPTEGVISREEIKFIGKTNLTKNMSVICLADLNLSLNFSPSINVAYASFYQKFTGLNLPGPYMEFEHVGAWPQTQSNRLPNKLIGYSNGKNIIKTEYFDNTTQTKKTRYDTIVSQGCSSLNSYTITLN